MSALTEVSPNEMSATPTVVNVTSEVSPSIANSVANSDGVEAADGGVEEGPVKKKARKSTVSEDGKMCHQCHQKREGFLKCTRYKAPNRICPGVYCEPCLVRVYGIDKTKIEDVPDKSNHITGAEVYWVCPQCTKSCQCAPCRRSRGKEPTGSGLESFAKSIGKQPHEVFQSEELIAQARNSRAEIRKEQAEKDAAKKSRKSDVSNHMQTLKLNDNGELGALPEKPRKGPKPKADRIIAEKVPKSAPTQQATLHQTWKVAVAPPPAPPKPAVVKPPKFTRLDVPRESAILWARLEVRIFSIRFRKIHKIVKKHLDTVNNPTGAWTSQTYKAVVLAALKVMQADDKKYWDNDEIYSLIKMVDTTKSTEHEKLWKPLEEYFPQFVHYMGDYTFEDEEDKIEYRQAVLTSYIQRVSMNSSVARNLLNDDQILAKEKHREFTEMKAQLTKDMVGTKGDERAVYTMRIGLLDFEHWYVQRALSSRSDPLLGEDLLGNKYYFFNQTNWLEDAWGHWIIIQKSPKLLHPSGKSRPSPEPTTAPATPAAPKVDHSGDVEMDDAPPANGFSAINDSDTITLKQNSANPSVAPSVASTGSSVTPGPEAQLQKELEQAVDEEDFDPSISWFCVFDSQEATKLGAWLSNQIFLQQQKGTIEPDVDERVKNLTNIVRRIAAYYEHEENAKARQFEVEEILSKGI